ncbi:MULTISPECIES: GNAT family N-acetyltransferase [Ramlibacter]|uniref:GNAT family N-acetyltransferase n=1 Tax=Ramlibacter pinisoli TaxID=2682844 RepID=A0A6N8IY99_9BURK|nr:MULTISPECIES: GNAT family N-acetyltransferase [Ramlibacter]MBA2960980.1 N-acetyltransferase [Ramlibacter sp. CGMCC 1.13660]MVQ30926.1 GNAT family N-acetyltransferase [Ramlibacter pinisoli]
MPAPATIRRLLPADAEAYRALMLEAYAATPDAFTSTVAERSALPLPWWAARLADDPGAGQRVCGAFVDGALAGAAGLAFEQRERTRHKALLFGMTVRPVFRRHGLGRALVEAVLREAAAAPSTRVVQLTVTDTNRAALRLYAACGFQPFGTEPMAVRVDGRDVAKVHMWRLVDRSG